MNARLAKILTSNDDYDLQLKSINAWYPTDASDRPDDGAELQAKTDQRSTA